MGTAIWAPVIGLFLGLEGLYWLLRRVLPSFRPRALFRFFQLLICGLWTTLRIDPATFETTGAKVLGAATALVGGWIVFSLLEALVLRGLRTDSSGRTAVPKLARDVLRAVTMLTLAFVVAHAVFGVALDRLTLSSATVVAILGFSLQDVLKNVFAGMTLQLEGAIHRGDWLLWNDVPARVVDMTFRATHLRTNDGHLYVVPNAEIAANRLILLGSGEEAVALPIYLSLPYSMPPGEAKRALLDAVRRTPGVVENPAPEVLIHKFEEAGVTYRVRPWSKEQSRLSRLQDSLFTRLWYRLQRDGVSLPYPVRTLRVHNQDRVDRAERNRRALRAETLLAEVPLFADLPALQLRALAAFAHERRFDAGEVLVREGEGGSSLYLIAAGQVRVTKTAGAEETLELALLGAGEFFGERSLLTGELRGATVIALTPCEVLVLDREAIAPLLASDPGLAGTLSRALAARDAENLARLETLRGRDRMTDPEVERSLLARIRHFFALPDA
jgi:small-conductance mechanosensitive channel/CRP-like cAMP-binding protein